MPAKFVKIGWIQSKKTSTYNYIKLNSSSNGLVVDSTKQEFKFIISPSQFGAYGLIGSIDANNTLTHVVKATDTADSTDSSAKTIQVIPKPTGVTEGVNLPGNLDNKLLFSIDPDGDKFKIKSKHLSTSSSTYVLHILGGTASSGTKIVAYQDSSATHQRWTFKSQSTSGKRFCTKSSTVNTPTTGTKIDEVSPQDEGVSDASPSIIDGKWVPVVSGENGIFIAGFDDPEVLGGKCYKFKMQQVTTTGFKKDRCELCRCFTRLSDISSKSVDEIANLIFCKYIYSLSHLETRCIQAATKTYEFKIYVKEWEGTRANVNVIFAQWHGMPNSLFFKVPDTGSSYKLEGPKIHSEAKTMWNDYGFKGGISKKGFTGNKYRYVEQGGKPPLAIKFKDDKVTVAINGDGRYFSDKYTPGTDTKKTGSITDVYNGTRDLWSSLSSFPLKKWVKFKVTVTWATYNNKSDGVASDGSVQVETFDCKTGNSLESFKKTGLNVGRNDSLGYYFKFGCYRHSTEKVKYLFKDYVET